MIQKTKAFQTSDGETFSEIESVQRHEVESMINAANPKFECLGSTVAVQEVATWIVANAEELADILTTKGSSKPATRSINGGTKERKRKGAKPVAAAAPQQTLPGTATE